MVNSNGWTRDLVEKHQVGLWAEPGSACSLVNQLQWLAEHPDKVQEMGLNARRLAVEQFDRQKLAVEFERVLLAAARQAPAAQVTQMAVPPMAVQKPEPGLLGPVAEATEHEVGA